MSEYSFVEKPFLDQLDALGWTVIDQGPGIPTDPTKSLRASFREVTLRDVFNHAVRAINTTADGRTWLTDKQLDDLHDDLFGHSGLRNIRRGEIAVNRSRLSDLRRTTRGSARSSSSSDAQSTTILPLGSHRGSPMNPGRWSRGCSATRARRTISSLTLTAPGLNTPMTVKSSCSGFKSWGRSRRLSDIRLIIRITCQLAWGSYRFAGVQLREQFSCFTWCPTAKRSVGDFFCTLGVDPPNGFAHRGTPTWVETQFMNAETHEQTGEVWITCLFTAYADGALPFVSRLNDLSDRS
jgi:hypothetical protein